MKQFQVPQFIDVEDKILGPITMRQFFIMLIPFGTGILLSFILSLWLAIIITVPVIVVSAVFAFYRPYGMRFSRFFAAFLAYQLKPRMYIWKRGGAPRVIFENSSGAGGQTDTHEKRVPKGGLKNIKGTIETGSTYREEKSGL